MQFFLNNKLYLLHLKWFRIQISYSCLFYDNRKKMQWVIYGGDNFFWQRLTSFIQKGPYNFLSKLWHQLVAKKKMISWFHDLLLPITFQNSTLENQEWYFRVIKQSQTNKLLKRTLLNRIYICLWDNSEINQSVQPSAIPLENILRISL